MSKELVQQLYDFLADGILPEGIHIKYPPHLGRRKAFSTIWFLQEFMGVIPSEYELCHKCGNIYDSDNEGSFLKGHNYCDFCVE